MPRRPDTPFWVEPASVGKDRLRLSPEESHHLLHVHRAAPGVPFEATDGRGSLYECVLEFVEHRSAVGCIVQHRRDVGELRRTIELLVGLPEWSATEQIVSLCVPLGVGALDFAACGRSGRGALSTSRLSRLERLARAGVKQSRRTRLPRIRSSPNLEEALVGLEAPLRFAGDIEGDRWDLSVPESIQVNVALAVGPPGAFTEPERVLLEEAGFRLISLGSSRLTTEAAATALLSLARNRLW